MTVVTDSPQQSERTYWRSAYVSTGVVQLLLFLAFAALATSRAAGHVLSAAAVCGIVTVAAASSAKIGWISNLYIGAADARRGAVEHEDAVGTIDPFAFGPMWRAAGAWALGAAAWALAGSGIVAVVLNGRVARFPTMFVALAGIAGVSAIAIGNAARRRGLASAVVQVTPVGLRTRAWRQLALPMALTQGLVQVGVAWLLFHSYPTGNAAVSGALTDKTALADSSLIVVVITVIFAGMATQWGAFDRSTGRVALDDPDTQTIPRRSPLGPQVLVYTAILGMVAFKLAAYVLPATPSLAIVMVTRGVLAALLVASGTAFGYVRGATNAGTE